MSFTRKDAFRGWLYASSFAALALLGACTGCRNSAQQDGAPRSAPPVQVVAIAAETQPVAESLAVVGSVAANEQVEIKSEIDGLVEAFHFQEGEAVEAGRLLIALNNTKLVAALAEAEANFELSRTTFERNKELAETSLISQQEYEQSAAAFELHRATVELRKRQLLDTRIHAPFEGIVGARPISPGQVITRNTTLTWISDLDPVKVEFNVPERFLGGIRPGQEIQIRVAAYPADTFEGRVFFVAPYVDPATRTSLLKAEIPNPGLLLKPGMFANLNLTLKVRDNSIVIPESGLFQLLPRDQARIYIVDSNQTAQLRTIKLGVRLPGRIEVLEGLQPGDAVIVEGYQKLGPGSKVTLAPPAAQEPYRLPLLESARNQLR